MEDGTDGRANEKQGGLKREQDSHLEHVEEGEDGGGERIGSG